VDASKEKQAKTSERAAVRQMEARCACPMLSPVPVPRTTRTSANGAGTRAGVRQRAQKRSGGDRANSGLREHSNSAVRRE